MLAVGSVAPLLVLTSNVMFELANVFISILVVMTNALVYVSKSTAQTEEHKYQVLKEYDKFEIRKYEPALFTSVKLDTKGYKESSNEGFSVLAGYIFGGNQSSQNIAMTAPVHIEKDSTESRMSFVMPADMSLESLPQPKDASVSLHKSAAGYFAALRFGGFAPEEVIQEKIAELQALLQEEGLRTQGGFRYLGYNAPFEVVGRRNEILVEIAYDEAATLEP